MPDQDGRPRRLITVVTDEAASAAADFLALGDYAIAYPDSSIVYHGTRRPFGGIVTAESARSVATALQRTNERFALRLADKVIGRIVLAAGQTGRGLSEYREIPSDDAWPNVEPIVNAQIKELIFDDVLDLARAAMERQDSIRNLTVAVISHLESLPEQPKSESGRDIEIFNAVFASKREQKNLEEWNFTKTGLQEVIADFELLRDYHFGDHRSEIGRLLALYGSVFLTTDDAKIFKGLKKEDRAKFLQSQAGNKLRGLWYYVMSACRLLQTTDFTFDAEEGFWFGLVDEVIGCPELVTHRLLAEEQPAPRPQEGKEKK